MKPVPRVLLVKAHVAAHTRKDGTQVRAYDTRVQARASGAGSNRFLIVSDADFEAYRAAGAPLIRDHVVHDVVSASGRSMREHAYPEAPRDLLETRRAGHRVAEPSPRVTSVSARS